MRSANGSATRYLLHVRPDSAELPSVARVRGQLAEKGVPVREFGDVYHALALIACSTAEPPLAVLIHVEAVAPEEWDFFRVAAHMRRAPRIYVYGDAHSSPKVGRALETGGCIPFSDAALNHLAAAETAKSEPVVEPVATQSTSASPISAAPPEAPVDVPPADAEPAPIYETVETVAAPGPDMDAEPIATEPADDVDQPVRVPWIRYADRPSRVRPVPGEAPSGPSRIADPKPLRPVPREPLLTEEEVRALLGDDVSMIAPRRFRMPPTPEPPTGRTS